MFNISFAGDESFNAEFQEPESMTAEFDTHIETPVTEYYEGSYEITPSDTPQTLDCGGLCSLRDIVINAVPSGWGKITWNGAFLTVS